MVLCGAAAKPFDEISYTSHADFASRVRLSCNGMVIATSIPTALHDSQPISVHLQATYWRMAILDPPPGVLRM